MERDYNAENISSHNRAHYGLIFFAGSTASLAAASQTQASKKSSWKKPHAKKRQG